MRFRKKGKKKRKEISEAHTVELELHEMTGLIDENVLHGCSSVIGKRKSQQDAVFVERNICENYTLAIICDGMGGLQGGAQASNMAVNYIANEFHKIHDSIDPELEMENIAEKADEIVSNLKDEKGNIMKAGTTVVAVLIKGNMLHWMSVGDSKIFLLRNGVLQCVTVPHNYSFMARQRINDSSFRFDPTVRQDALISYLGAGHLSYIDLSPSNMELENDDMVLLCSDGLYNTLTEEQISAVMTGDEINMQKLAEALTDLAIKQGKKNQDNTTVIVLKYKKEE